MSAADQERRGEKLEVIEGSAGQTADAAEAGATATEKQGSPERSNLGTGLKLLALIALIAAFTLAAVWLMRSMQSQGELETRVVALQAELETTQAALDAERAHGAQLQGRMDQVSEITTSLQETFAQLQALATGSELAGEAGETGLLGEITDFMGDAAASGGALLDTAAEAVTETIAGGSEPGAAGTEVATEAAPEASVGVDELEEIEILGDAEPATSVPESELVMPVEILEPEPLVADDLPGMTAPSGEETELPAAQPGFRQRAEEWLGIESEQPR
jgi:cell division protein FtsB